MKQPSFEITGSPKAEKTQPSSIGQQPGEIGSGALSKAVVDKLASQSPFETMANLRHSLEKRYGLSRSVRTTVMAGEPDFAMVPIGEADYDGAIAAVQASMTPCPDAVLEKALALLSSRCAGRRGDGDETGFKVAVVKNDLRAYPVDIVLFVLDEWSKHNRWLPERADLFPKLESLTQKRRDILASLMWSKTKTFRPAEPVKEISGKSWDNPPDHVMANPAAPVRDKTDMASQLRSMEAP